MKEYEVVIEDYVMPDVEEERSIAFVIKLNTQIMNEDMRKKEKNTGEDGEWLENFKRNLEYKEEQEEIEITPEIIKEILRKMPNLNTHGPDLFPRFLVEKC